MVVTEDIGVGAVECGRCVQRGSTNLVMISYSATLKCRLWVCKGMTESLGARTSVDTACPSARRSAPSEGYRPAILFDTHTMGDHSER